jgi:HEAT repeat protein
MSAPPTPPPPAAVLRAVRRALQAQDPVARYAALQRVGGVRLPEAALQAELEDAVADALSDAEPDVRVAAIRALVRLGARDALRALITASSDDPSTHVRREAVAALARLVSAPRTASG